MLSEGVRKCNFLNAMLQGDRQFMTETKKIKQHKKNTPSSVDNHYTPLNIANLFAEKYNVLFNSCTSNQQKLDSMWEQLTQDIVSNDITELYTSDIIRESIKSLKSGKQDAVHDLMIEYFIHAPVCFYDCLCSFYNACLTRGFIPKKMLISILDLSNSDAVSDNYRAIALCDLFMKIFEYCVLNTNRDELLVSGLQFALKPEHSTTQCSWAAKEVEHSFG